MIWKYVMEAGEDKPPVPHVVVNIVHFSERQHSNITHFWFDRQNKHKKNILIFGVQVRYLHFHDITVLPR